MGLLKAGVGKKLLIAIGGVTVCTAGVVTHQLMTMQPGCACLSETKGVHLGALWRAQQAHFAEKGELADEQALGETFGTPIDELSAETYRYRTELQDVKGRTIAYTFATPHDTNFRGQIGPISGPKRPTYHSAVSAIARIEAESEAAGSNSWTGVICVNDSPSSEALPAPELTDNLFICPAGSTQTRSL